MQDLTERTVTTTTTTTTSSSPRLARLAAYAATAASGAAAASAGAAIYSQTGLDLKVGFVAGVATNQTITLTGAASAAVLTLQGVAKNTAVGTNFRRWASVAGGGAQFKTIVQSASVGNIGGGLPVGYGRTWLAPGRTSGSFADWRQFGTAGQGGVNLSTSNWSDFQQVDGGTTWYMLFCFTQASQTVYGWLSFTATIEGIGATSNNYMQITGWGWDDGGGYLPAGFTASAIPGGGGLLALAIGAAGLRGRRRNA
jgi:hypothetical protein